MVDEGDGPVEGQVHLGGSLDLDSNPARLRQQWVTSDELGDYIGASCAIHRQRQPGERFAQWAVRADEEALR